MMDAQDVASFIATMERETKSRAARVAMAKAAIKIGKVTEGGRDVWRAYLARIEGRDAA